ncbi:MAG: hypothetical protein JNJ98_15875 [Gemmatimonadetes bacterium]|nr:hypothetical protein [Gemmatimonadota bacterium]
MRSLVIRVIGVAAGLTGLVALRSLSLVPHGAAVPHAVLRLSWSARPERVEVCRELSDAELAARPVHMRLRTECSGRFASYLLTVRVGDGTVLSDTVRGGGLRNDRPIHLLREVQVPPGSQPVRVSLARIDSTAAPRDTSATDVGALGDRAQRETDERRRRAAEALPGRLELDQTTRFVAGRVVMVTYANEQRRLILTNGGIP